MQNPDDVLGSLANGADDGGAPVAHDDPHAGPARAEPHAEHPHEDPHAGHTHADPLRPSADVSVRPALPEDAPALGDLHARTLRATLTAGTGDELPQSVAGAIDPVSLAQVWLAAITSPPSPRHRVLSALAGSQVVGLAAIAPAEEPVDVVPARVEAATADTGNDAGTPYGERAENESPSGARPSTPPSPDGAELQPETGPVGEIIALEVPAAFARRGHGSRLLAACADLLREQGVRRVQTWAVQGDESRARFLGEAGFVPAGVRRHLDVGGAEAVEICWYAEL